MATKAYEMVARVKYLAGITSSITSEDNNILRTINDVQWLIYHANPRWKPMQSSGSLYTTETLTLDTAPSTAWAAGDTITGATSEVTSTIVEAVTTKIFRIKDRSGDYTDGEVLTNGTYTADQGDDYPTVTHGAYNAYLEAPSTLQHLYTLRQTSDSPYRKLTYVPVQKFHELIPQPTEHASSMPTHYTWWNSKLWFFPIPDQTYTLTWNGYLKPVNCKIYTTGTAAHSGTAVTGTSTYWSNNANVDTNMFFAYQDDVRSDGTYPWSAITTVTDNDTLAIATYTGSSGASTVNYACSSELSYSTDFDPLIEYWAAWITAGRNRDLVDESYREFLRQQKDALLASLIMSQSYTPDSRPVLEDFTPSPHQRMFGGVAYQYPFLKRDI